MERIKFYSEYDMTSGMNISRIIEFVNCFSDANGEDDINEILEYFNIIKFYSVENFKNIIKTETEGRIDEVIKILQGIIGKYIGTNKFNNFLSLYEEVDISYKEDFWQLIDRYNIYKHIENVEFGNLLKESNFHYSVILKYKRTVDNFDEVLRDHMLQDSKGAKNFTPQIYL